MKHISHGIVFDPAADGGGAGAGDGKDGADDNDDDDDPDEDELTPEEIAELRAENARLKKDAAKRRTAAAREKKAEKDAARRGEKKDSDDADLKRELATEREAREAAELRANRANARAIAKELGAANPSTAVRLIDFEEFDDPSDEDEVTDALKELFKKEPYLKGAKAKTDGGSGGGDSGKFDMNTEIRRAGGRG